MVVLGAAAFGAAGPVAQRSIDPLPAGTCVLGQETPVLQPSGADPAAQPEGGAEPALHPLAGLLIFAGASALSVWVIVHRRLWQLPTKRPGITPPEPKGVELLVIAGMAIYLGSQVGALAAIQAFDTSGPEGRLDLSLRTTALGMAGMYSAGAVVVGLVLWRWPTIVGQIGLRARARDVLVGIGWLALAMPILLLVGALLMLMAGALRGAPPDPTAHVTLTALQEGVDGWGIAVMVLVVIGAPCFEEIIYRGFAQTAMRMGLGPSARSGWVAIVFASALFTAVHVGAVAWYALPILTCLSVVLGVAYERSGRLVIPIVFHAGFNALQLMYSLR